VRHASLAGPVKVSSQFACQVPDQPHLLIFRGSRPFSREQRGGYPRLRKRDRALTGYWHLTGG